MYTYSNRLPWSAAANPLSRLRQAKQIAGESILDLTLSNPVAASFEYPHARLQEIFASLRHFSYAPDPRGDIAARTAVSTYYARQGITVDPAEIALTASTSEAYSVLFKLLCDPGDEILVPTPSYPLLEYLAALESVRVVPYRLLYAGSWFIDFAHLQSVLSDRTRAIVVVNPNNPTGSFLKTGEHSFLSEIAAERRLPVISDEVFADYPVSPTPDAMPTLIGSSKSLGFSLNGLSKTAGMPQLKLGWIAIHGAREEVDQASAPLEHILDTYLSVATPVQKLLPDLLSTGSEFQGQIRNRINNNVRTLAERLRGSAVQPLHTEGGWSAILQLPGTRSEEYWTTTLLERHNVAVQPGYFFDMASEAYIVVSLLTPPADLIAGVERLVSMTNDE